MLLALDRTWCDRVVEIDPFKSKVYYKKLYDYVWGRDRLTKGFDKNVDKTYLSLDFRHLTVNIVHDMAHSLRIVCIWLITSIIKCDGKDNPTKEF